MSRMWKTEKVPTSVMISYEEEAWLAIWKGRNSIRVFGKDFRIDTPVDYLCVECRKHGNLNSPFLVDGDMYCAIHMKLTKEQLIHKVQTHEYYDDTFLYKDELCDRIRLKESEMTDERQEYAVVVQNQPSPLLPSKEEKKVLISDYIKSSLVPRSDFGDYAEPAAEYLAIVALVHGLDPMLKEVSVWPIKRWNAKEKKQEIIGIQTHIGPSGYKRQADREAAAGNPYALGSMSPLSRDEKIARFAHLCPTCSGVGTTGKGNYTKPCVRCKGKGEFDIDGVIVVRAEIYLEKQAAVAVRCGLKPEPIVGYGVFRPGDSIPEGRDPMWRAESRARKDMYKLAYSLQLWLPSVDALDTPLPEGAVFISDDNGDVVNITPTIVEEHGDVEEEAEDRSEPDFTDLAFGDTLDGFEKYLLKGILVRCGYEHGAPQNGLIAALFGGDATWKNITTGQAQNMWEYAKRAHAAVDSGMKGEELKAYKTQLKDVCRKHTAEEKLWEHMEDTVSD